MIVLYHGARLPCHHLHSDGNGRRNQLCSPPKRRNPSKRRNPPQRREPPEIPHDLNSFFGASHHPLSFSYFDATAQPSPIAPKPEAQTREVVAPSASESSSNSPSLNAIPSLNKIPSGNESPFSVMSGTTMDTIQQAIRDLKLTIAEMDEKLDRVVQKVAPEGKRISRMAIIFSSKFHEECG
ncbi:unnamed protein product [Bemisia tabaci]|uniref:Uncharacterized protein n=1 Tax=Bemisia tabaci TaxID=7038 RepID=A0A9P0A4Z8_BEMTA|nr:unnamed protein product [Bemisia tabaci]